jgi:hypothetical protein
MQSLTFLDLGDYFDAWPHLLPLLCASAATPLLLRLQTLLLPPSVDDDSGHELYDGFLCRLSSLSAPPALQRFAGVAARRHSAASLRSVFSLPHLSLLRLRGYVQRSELLAFTSSITNALAPLVSLVLPSYRPDDGDHEEAAVAEEAAALCSGVRRLLSCITSLRRLQCDADIASGAFTGDDSCSVRLNSLLLHDDTEPPVRCPFTAPLSFPVLTELVVTLPLKDVELELLLSACPRLLTLDCMVYESDQVALIAARSCPSLLQLRATIRQDIFLARDTDLAAPQPAVSGPFLPQLVSLDLDDGDGSDSRFSLCDATGLGASPPLLTLNCSTCACTAAG